MSIIAVEGPVSARDAAMIKAVVAGIVPEMRAHFEDLNEALVAENKALADRIAALEARPAPEKGEPGEKGADGVEGQPGADGKDGEDGRGVKELLVDRDGVLVATMDDGSIKSLGPIVGKDGEAGNDGRDGIDLTSFEAIVLDDDRTIQFSLKGGDFEHVTTLKWPTAIYRGVFKDGDDYERGDMTTWGGSLWHCDVPTKQKPGTDDWTLAAKKGRDGKDAKHG